MPIPTTSAQRSDNTAHSESIQWLSPQEREGWLFISSIIFSLTRKLENQLQSEAGISFVEYMVLAMLSESKDHSLTMTELAVTTNTLPARLSRVVARLEKDGYVRPFPQCRRPPRQHLPLAPRRRAEGARRSHPAT